MHLIALRIVTQEKRFK